MHSICSAMPSVSSSLVLHILIETFIEVQIKAACRLMHVRCIKLLMQFTLYHKPDKNMSPLTNEFLGRRCVIGSCFVNVLLKCIQHMHMVSGIAKPAMLNAWHCFYKGTLLNLSLCCKLDMVSEDHSFTT